MKAVQFYIVFLSLVLLLGSLRFSMVTSWYQYNQKIIEKYLCENIDEPELQCNGKCFLSKNLTQQSEEEKSENIVIIYKIDQFLTQTTIDLNNPFQTIIEQKKVTSHQSFFLDKVINKRLLKPPIV